MEDNKSIDNLLRMFIKCQINLYCMTRLLIDKGILNKEEIIEELGASLQKIEDETDEKLIAEIKKDLFMT